MERATLEECEIGDWITVQSLVIERAINFSGIATGPDGQIRQFREIEVPCAGGTDIAWKRVS